DRDARTQTNRIADRFPAAGRLVAAGSEDPDGRCNVGSRLPDGLADPLSARLQPVDPRPQVPQAGDQTRVRGGRGILDPRTGPAAAVVLVRICRTTAGRLKGTGLRQALQV